MKRAHDRVRAARKFITFRLRGEVFDSAGRCGTGRVCAEVVGFLVHKVDIDLVGDDAGFEAFVEQAFHAFAAALAVVEG
jgi:hypothetical protein